VHYRITKHHILLKCCNALALALHNPIRLHFNNKYTTIPLYHLVHYLSFSATLQCEVRLCSELLQRLKRLVSIYAAHTAAAVAAVSTAGDSSYGGSSNLHGMSGIGHHLTDALQKSLFKENFWYVLFSEPT
jgi:hypothetical protein